MAYGQLPLYHKNSKVVGAGITIKRWKEYYLLVVTLFGFLMLYAGVLWFVPSVEVHDSYGRAYSSFTGSMGSDVFSEPTLAQQHLNSEPSLLLPSTDQIGIKREQDHSVRQRPEDNRNVESREVRPVPSVTPSHSDTLSLRKSAVPISVISPSGLGGDGNITAKRREKIVEVSMKFILAYGKHVFDGIEPLGNV